MNKVFSFLAAIVIVLVVTFGTLQAEIKLPSIFSDNMVLQQQTEAAIWGNATVNSTIRVTTSWNGKAYTVHADKDGRWKVKVSTPSAGGPFSINLSDGKALTLKNVMIGEVWVCSGQSNMVMPMKGYRNQPVIGSNEVIATSSGNNIRLFTVSRIASLVPLDDFTGTWKISEPENVSEFSATAYFFAMMLNKVLNVPIGLINTSWGGTKIEPWISEAGFKNFGWVKLPDKTAVQGTLSQQTPTVLFNAMINPIVGYGIRGAIWYQGENNCSEPANYQLLLPGFVESWRSAWGIGEFSFYYVQIAPFNYGPTAISSAYLREAQLKASAKISNAGMASIIDCGEKDNVHPADKATPGKRLAYLALAKTYGKKGFACEGPVLREMKVEGNQVKLTFDNAINGLTSFGKELTCFEVAGPNKRFYPAQAFITGTGITLFSPMVAEPVSVRYAFKDFITGDLFNTEGLPASSFRTDDWEIM
jgi:sialate O-acetylesterase